MDLEIRQLQAGDERLGFLETIGNLSKEDETKIFNQEAFYQNLQLMYYLGWNHYALVAVLDGEIVGTAMVLVKRGFIHGCAKAAIIEDVVTRAGFEGRGIATALMRRLEETAADLGCYKDMLYCSEENVPFYEKLGYRRHEVLMRKDLRGSA